MSDGMIISGELLTSVSGRALAPVPLISTKSRTSITKSRRRINAWLLDEAIRECVATDQMWLLGVVRGIDLRNLSPSDVHTLNDVVFGRPFGPEKDNRVKPA